MTIWIVYFAALSVLVGVWAWAHRPGWWTVGVYPVLVFALYFSAVEVMGTSKPKWLEWREMDVVRVISYVLDEPSAIHIWIEAKDGPRAYVIPWDKKIARQLRAADSDARGRETDLKMKFRFEPSLDEGEQMFWALPPEAYPSKDEQ